MKRLVTLNCCFLLIVLSVTAQELPVKLSINQPAVGDSITFTYQKSDTSLVQQVTLRTYVGPFTSKTKLVTFEEKDNTVTGAFRVIDSANLLVITFSGPEGTKAKGAMFPVYKQGKLVRGALANMGLMYQGLGENMFGLPKNNEKALALYEQEVKDYPDEELTYIASSVSILMALDKEEDAKKLLAAAEQKGLANKQTPESDLYHVQVAYGNYLKDATKAEEIEQEILIRYPNGKSAMSKAINAFLAERDIVAQKQAYDNIINRFSAVMDSYTKVFLDSKRASIAAAEKDTVAFNKYSALIKDPLEKAQLFNSIAWPLAEKAENLAFATQLSKESLQLVDSVIRNPTQYAPQGYAPEKFKSMAQNNYKTYADTYALLLYHQGDKSGALTYQEQAIDGGISSADVNQRYVKYLKDMDKVDTLLIFSNKAIVEGKSNDSLVADLKQVYLKKHSESEWNTYIESLEEQYLVKAKEHLKSEVIKESAPPFTLMNLAGQQVSLASLKGKVVIVDFWATWCGPCKASFPGMQMAVNKYKEGDDVAFLFINTWERIDDREKAVRDFITSNQYTFNVLMDSEKKKGTFDVVSAFDVSGIPTKFIIDKSGNIRFKAIGYSGSPSEELKKISLMVDMLRTGEL